MLGPEPFGVDDVVSDEVVGGLDLLGVALGPLVDQVDDELDTGWARPPP